MAEAKKAKGFLGKIFNFHTLKMASLHLTLMAGMVFMPVAAAAAAAQTTVTAGDLGLGALDMLSVMVTGWGDIGVLGEAFANAQAGDWAAQSYEMGMHSHGVGGHDMVSGLEASHAAHIPSAGAAHPFHPPEHLVPPTDASNPCGGPAFGEWIGDVGASGEFEAYNQDAIDGGIGLWDRFQQECG